MTDLVRFGISVDRELMGLFDTVCQRKGYANRSEAIRDLMRAFLVEEEWETGTEETVGTVTLVFDHDVLDLPRKLTKIQHEHDRIVVSTTHIHLDRHNCLEVLILRGPAAQVRALGEALSSLKGVKHGKLTMTTTGRALP